MVDLESTFLVHLMHRCLQTQGSCIPLWRSRRLRFDYLHKETLVPVFCQKKKNISLCLSSEPGLQSLKICLHRKWEGKERENKGTNAEIVNLHLRKIPCIITALEGWSRRPGQWPWQFKQRGQPSKSMHDMFSRIITI